MSAAQVDPHDKMRSRDVRRVAKGEQAPKPACDSASHVHGIDNKHRFDETKVDEGNDLEELKSALADIRFPSTNQTRHCYTRYIEFHKCIQKKGKDAPEWEKLAKYYRSLCPAEWIERWDEQRQLGTFPVPVKT